MYLHFILSRIFASCRDSKMFRNLKTVTIMFWRHAPNTTKNIFIAFLERTRDSRTRERVGRGHSAVSPRICISSDVNRDRFAILASQKRIFCVQKSVGSVELSDGRSSRDVTNN